jgi:O-antigen/teichoic acid export membrane protein
VTSLSRSRRVLQALAASYLLFAVKSLARFFVTPFYLAALGAELIGLQAFIRETLSYIQLTNLGVPRAIAAVVARDAQEGRTPEQAEGSLRELRAGAQVQQLLSCAAILLSLVVAANLEHLAQGLPAESLEMARWCTIAFGIVLYFELLSGVYASILDGKQLIAQKSLYEVCRSLLDAGVGVALVYIGWSLYGLAAAALVSVIILLVQLRWRTGREGVRLRLLSPPLERDKMRSMLGLSGLMLVMAAGGLLSTQSARVILGLTPGLGMEAVTRYSLLMALPAIVWSQSNRFSILLRPGLTQLHHSDESKDKLVRLAVLLLRGSSFLAAAGFLMVWLVNGSFVVLWVGAEYYSGQLCNWLAAVLVAERVLLFPYSVLLQARFEFRRVARASIVAGILNVALAVILLRPLGLAGVLAASVLSDLLVFLPAFAGPVLAWITRDRSALKVVASIIHVPVLFLGAWVVILMTVAPELRTWTELIVASGVLAGSGLVVAGCWLWRDLKPYAVIR